MGITQKQTSDFLAGLNLPHIRPEHTQPNLSYQVSYSASNLVGTECLPVDAEFRVDGREEDRLPPGPLKYATIGSNGRDVDTGQVYFLGVDIDGLNHSRGHNDKTVAHWIEKLSRIAWLQLNFSRSGNGVHGYVFLAQEIIAADNSEMVALGAALKQRIADEVGDDGFLDIADVAGTVIFYYSPNPGERGYELIKPATVLFTEKLEPLYDPGDPAYDVEDVKELDTEHAKHVEWLSQNHRKNFQQTTPTTFYCHTSDIQRMYEDLGLKGNFDTAATGEGDAKQNAWWRALSDGRWMLGTLGHEEPTWLKSRRGGYYTILNAAPTLAEFVSEQGILYDARTRSYSFNLEEAKNFCRLCGVAMPETNADPISVSQQRENIVLEIEIKASDDVQAPWRRKSKKKAYFAFPATLKSKPNPFSKVRVAYSPEGKGFQPFARVHGKHWQPTTYEDASTRLELAGFDPFAIKRHLATDTPYVLVVDPFKGEFPSKYGWNICAVQLAYPIAKQPGDYTHWQSILDHCGEGLNIVVANDLWCREFGITTGADYLKWWAARLFRYPKRRLPGLGFFSSQQNCGKSTLPSSLGMLMTRGGYINTATPLTTEFNSILCGCVLWDLDDIDLAQRQEELYRKLQPWMTSDEISIVGKGSNATQVDNTLHIIHTADKLDCFALRADDTRWVLSEVQPLTQEIPKDELTRRLVREAPYFLKALFDIEMPDEGAGRMYLPVLDTSIKLRLAAQRSLQHLDTDQHKWLAKLKLLGTKGKLALPTSFEELKTLMGDDAPPTGMALQGVWPRIAGILETDGFEVSHSRHSGGNRPATWSVRKLRLTKPEQLKPATNEIAA